MKEKDHQKWWVTMLQMQMYHCVKLTVVIHLLPSHLIEHEYMNSLYFQMIICRFQVIQTSRDPSLSIFMLLEPYGLSSPPYIHLKWHLHWWKAQSLTLWKSLTYKSKHKKSLETNKATLFSIQNQWKKVWFWMSNTRNNQIDGTYFARYFQFFDQKSYIIIFLKINFSMFER